MCTNHRGLALLSLPSSVPGTLERRVCPLVKPPIQDDFQSWKLDQLFILSRIFESRGRLLNHSTRVLCTWRTHSIAFLEVSLGGCFRGMRCLVCKSWTFPLVVWLHQRCSVSHINILWTEYLGWCGSVGFIGCNLRVALQLSVKRRELEWSPRGLRPWFVEWPLRVREQLPKVEELKYLRVLFTSDRRVETEIDRWFLAVGHHECCIALFFWRESWA